MDVYEFCNIHKMAFLMGATCPACERAKKGLRGSLRINERLWVGMVAAPQYAMCALAALLLVCGGCATANQRCDYYPDGLLEHYRLRSTVVGTGETEVVTTDCAALAYSTRDTGLSDNGKEALGKIAEGAAKGAVKALLPLP